MFYINGVLLLLTATFSAETFIITSFFINKKLVGSKAKRYIYIAKYINTVQN